MALVVINPKTARSKWKKIAYVSLAIDVLLFISSALESGERTIFTFIVIFFGLFIAVGAIWTTVSSILPNGNENVDGNLKR